jgi:hypothetical protein
MSTTHSLKRIIAGALLSGGVAVAGLGLAAGTAQAERGFAPLSHDPFPEAIGPRQWCPGQELPQVGTDDPQAQVHWDMNVCHTYYIVDPGLGNVASIIWDGPNPPANPPRQCWSLFLPAPCCATTSSC